MLWTFFSNIQNTIQPDWIDHEHSSKFITKWSIRRMTKHREQELCTEVNIIDIFMQNILLSNGVLFLWYSLQKALRLLRLQESISYGYHITGKWLVCHSSYIIKKKRKSHRCVALLIFKFLELTYLINVLLLS